MKEQLRPTLSSSSTQASSSSTKASSSSIKASSCAISASVFMIRLDPSTMGHGEAIIILTNTHGNPRKVAAWRNKSTAELVDNFHATFQRFEGHKVRRWNLLQAIQAQRYAENLRPLRNHPLQGIRMEQESQMARCVNFMSSARMAGGPSIPTPIETAISSGALSREELVGAFVILESAEANIISENHALVGRWGRRNGSWDGRKGNIREIRETLTRL